MTQSFLHKLRGIGEEVEGGGTVLEEECGGAAVDDGEEGAAVDECGNGAVVVTAAVVDGAPDVLGGAVVKASEEECGGAAVDIWAVVDIPIVVKVAQVNFEVGEQKTSTALDLSPEKAHRSTHAKNDDKQKGKNKNHRPVAKDEKTHFLMQCFLQQKRPNSTKK